MAISGDEFVMVQPVGTLCSVIVAMVFVAGNNMEDLQYSSVSGIPSLSSSRSIELIIPSPSKSSAGSIPPTVCAPANTLSNKNIETKKDTLWDKILRIQLNNMQGNFWNVQKCNLL